MPPSEVTQSASSSASPLPAASGSRSDSTPVEVSACTAAISFGAGCAASTRSASTGCPHSCSTATTSAPQRDATSTMRCAEQPVHRDDDDVARAHGVDERRLHARRPGRRERQRAPVRRPEDLPQPLGRLVQHREEQRVEVPEQRLAEGGLRLRVGVRRAGSEQGAGAQRHAEQPTGGAAQQPSAVIRLIVSERSSDSDGPTVDDDQRGRSCLLESVGPAPGSPGSAGSSGFASMPASLRWASLIGVGAPVSGSKPGAGLREGDDLADRVHAR